MGKLSLYWHTVKSLKPEQIIYRVTKKLKMDCTLGLKTNIGTDFGPISLLPQLDFDTAFLSRFPVEALMQDRIILLHETETFHWNTPWHFKNRSALWNYNLHYFEYLFPLVKCWLDTRERPYLKKVQQIILGWIQSNPKDSGGVGWDAYPTSLRLINWLSCYGYLETDLDEDFKKQMLDSLKVQYAHLATRLEKHLLGNHYFENLKTLVICGVFFQDSAMTKAALTELKKECAEQILSDGMHFELSPMYHKIILEDMLRTADALRRTGTGDGQLEQYLQPMVDVAYSLEEGLERIPLFNDCGDNITKSLDALLLTAKDVFNIEPRYRSQLPDSGYYIFKTGDWKIIVDAGQPGPVYLPGHAHCDAMSFELFHKGKPVLVNCGTYAYQSEDRLDYKSTAAHNTVMRKGVEQSQCWGSFRMGRRAKVSVKEIHDTAISMELRDWAGEIIAREISVEPDGIAVRDHAKGQILVSYVHFADNGKDLVDLCESICEDKEIVEQAYAPEYGRKEMIDTIKLSSENCVEYKLGFTK